MRYTHFVMEFPGLIITLCFLIFSGHKIDSGEGLEILEYETGNREFDKVIKTNKGLNDIWQPFVAMYQLY